MSDIANKDRRGVLVEAVDGTAMASTIFDHLEALFKSISQIAGNGSELHQFMHIKQLADLGSYVASDWANTTGCMSEGYQDALDAVNRSGGAS